VRRFFLLTLTILLLSTISLIALSVMKGAPKYIPREIIYILLGFLVWYIVTNFNFRILTNFAFLIYGVSIFLLVLVMVIGIAKNSSRRWIDFFGIFTIQPSEIAKIAVIIVLSFISSVDWEGYKKFLLSTALVLPVLVLISLQPDMGSALVIAFIYFMFAAFTLHPKFSIAIALAAIASIPILPKILLPYQLERILIFFDPYRDPLGSGYNVLQSIIAVGSGTIFGKGISQSTMTKLNFVPVQYADFIFSAIGEIFGFIGAAVLVILLGVLLYYTAKAYASTKNRFGKGLAIGIFAMFFFQILVNVGMSIGIMPVTGIPLPFVSYGGSSTIANFICLGLITNVIIYKDEITMMP